MLNGNRKFGYQIFLSFPFSRTQQSIIVIKILMSCLIALLAVTT